jgi:ketosteroid isomerase-like protein
VTQPSRRGRGRVPPSNQGSRASGGHTYAGTPYDCGLVEESPIAELLAAVDELDVDAATALYARDATVMTVDGQRAEGIEAIRELLTAFFGGLRSTTHRITAQWHEDNVWIAEAEVAYALRDGQQTTALPRAFVLREGPDGIEDLRIYGAHERALVDHPTAGLATFVRGRWIPPL